VGGGPRGNVGSQAIRHVVLDPGLGRRLAAAGAAVEGARNHLPAAGGSHPVSAEYASVYAPDRIHTSSFQERCVTEQDSARLARDHPEVRRAVARHLWDGGGRCVELYVQRQGGLPHDAAFEARLRDWLRDKLLAGWDLALRPPRYVPLDVEVAVWIDPGERVERIYRRFAEDRAGTGGGPIFDPDLFDFGQPVYLSRITSALLAVPGVRDVRVDAFHRWGRPPAGEREAGYVPIGPLEMPRLDNDPDAPQRGTFRIRFEEDER
jgi:predicted phage baseplate assembly protein